MLPPEQIIEINDSGRSSPIEVTIAMPSGWTEEDCRLIGNPVVIGHETSGFVGALHQEGNPVTVWFSNATRPSFFEARQDVFAEAVRQKAHLPKSTA